VQATGFKMSLKLNISIILLFMLIIRFQNLRVSDGSNHPMCEEPTYTWSWDLSIYTLYLLL